MPRVSGGPLRILVNAILLGLSLPLMAIAAISFWTLAVMSCVLRQAMQVPVAAAVLIIIGCQALLLMIVFSFIGPAGS